MDLRLIAIGKALSVVSVGDLTDLKLDDYNMRSWRSKGNFYWIYGPIKNGYAVSIGIVIYSPLLYALDTKWRRLLYTLCKLWRNR